MDGMLSRLPRSDRLRLRGLLFHWRTHALHIHGDDLVFGAHRVLVALAARDDVHEVLGDVKGGVEDAAGRAFGRAAYLAFIAAIHLPAWAAHRGPRPALRQTPPVKRRARGALRSSRGSTRRRIASLRGK